MDTALHTFIKQYVGVVASALMVVALTAFLSIPLNLGREPGAVRLLDEGASWHAT